MKKTEAIEEFECAISILKECVEAIEFDSSLEYKYQWAFKMGIEALEKRLPKQPHLELWSPARCPSCGEELSESMGDGYYHHYYELDTCPNPDCNQRLDWGWE